MNRARRALSLGPLLAILLGFAAAARASGQWYDASISPVDPSSYYKTDGTITGLNPAGKPPVIQFTTDEGEDLVLVIPKWALLSAKGKLIRLRDLQKGQRGTLMWTVIDDKRAVGSLDIAVPEPPKPLPPYSTIQKPAVPQINPSMLRPSQMVQPVAPPMPPPPAPSPAPAIQRPITPVAPPSQDLRR